MPNAGKSTLLSRLSAARPKIADYPFTTLKPQLGIAELDAERRLVIADIPGLIEGAHEGAGLGLTFLRHIERTRVLVHLIDMMSLEDITPIEAYESLRSELAKYSPKLAAKPEILVANKMDLTGAPEALADLRDYLPGKQIFAISAVTGTGLRPLLEEIWQNVQRAPKGEAIVDAPPAIMSDVSAWPTAADTVQATDRSTATQSSETAADDAELAAEVQAMKADDQRKGKFYRRSRKTT